MDDLHTIVVTIEIRAPSGEGAREYLERLLRVEHLDTPYVAGFTVNADVTVEDFRH